MGKKRLIWDFLKDESLHGLIYIIGCTCLILFYQIITNHALELVYPIALAGCIYLVYMGIAYFMYVRSYQKLFRMIKHSALVEDFHLQKDKRICEIINQIHQNYGNMLIEEKEKKRKEQNMISAWVHNMKTPVTVTELMLQRLKNGENEAVTIADLQGENKKIVAYLDNILNMLRLENFEKDYIPQEIDLVLEVKKVINQNKSLFIQNGVYPKLEVSKEQVNVLVDAKWNAVMLQQILSNAVKYSSVVLKHESESVTKDNVMKYVTFRIREINSEKKKRVELSIQDEGIGIADYDLSKVFDLFFTGENGRKVEQSSGIGLYFAKEISRMFGAELGITSILGKGTTVTVSYLYN